jgi:hypothetical protein
MICILKDQGGLGSGGDKKNLVFLANGYISFFRGIFLVGRF